MQYHTHPGYSIHFQISLAIASFQMNEIWESGHDVVQFGNRLDPRFSLFSGPH